MTHALTEESGSSHIVVFRMKSNGACQADVGPHTYLVRGRGGIILLPWEVTVAKM